MAQVTSKGNPIAALSTKILDLVRTIQQNMQRIENRLQRVEDASKNFIETQKLTNQTTPTPTIKPPSITRPTQCTTQLTNTSENKRTRQVLGLSGALDT
jgi:hypothetical protein